MIYCFKAVTFEVVDNKTCMVKSRHVALPLSAFEYQSGVSFFDMEEDGRNIQWNKHLGWIKSGTPQSKNDSLEM